MTKRISEVERLEVQDLCPVCSEPLKQDGEYLAHLDHYKISKISYDRAWEVYGLASKKTFEQQEEAGINLMDMLLDTNVAENKPSIEHFWKVPNESTTIN